LLAVEGGEVRSLVETRDDAMGEVFDKVGKRLGLAYPQGPKVDLLAETGTPSGKAPFAVPKVKNDRQGAELFFSYSGLKTEAIRHIEALERQGVLAGERPTTSEGDWPSPVRRLMADFRQAAVAQIIDRLDRQRRRRPFEVLAVSGGAAANRLLRRQLTAWAADRGVQLFLVPLRYSGDNAAMIAFAALLRERRGSRGDALDTVVASRIPFPQAAS
jgi:N6-L-threonylcarbamoyladenine synthase